MKFICIYILLLIALPAFSQNKNAAGMTFSADSAAHVELCKWKYQRAHMWSFTYALLGLGLTSYSFTLNSNPAIAYDHDSINYTLKKTTYTAGLCLTGLAVVTYLSADRWLSKKNLTFTGDKLSYRF